MNERAVKICQNINIIEQSSDELILDFTGKSSLVKAYQRFCLDLNFQNLTIRADTNFPEACKAFNSIFTRVEAAGGIVRNAKEEYLFIKRLGFWDLPKGKLHKKEPAAECALREVTEETGLKNLTLSRQLQSTYHIYTDRKGKEILKETYWFEMRCNEDQELIPQLEEDITEVKWFAADELNIPLENTYASLRLLLSGYL